MPTDPSPRQRVREAIAYVKKDLDALCTQPSIGEPNCEYLRAQAEQNYRNSIQNLGSMWKEIETLLTPSSPMTQEEAEKRADAVLMSLRQRPYPGSQGWTDARDKIAAALLKADSDARLSCAAEMEQKDKEIVNLRKELDTGETAVDRACDELFARCQQLEAERDRLRERLEATQELAAALDGVWRSNQTLDGMKRLEKARKAVADLSPQPPREGE